MLVISILLARGLAEAGSVHADLEAQMASLTPGDTVSVSQTTKNQGPAPAVTSTTATGIDTFHPDPPSIDHGNPSGVWTVIAGASGQDVAGAGATSYTFPTGYTTNAIDLGQDDTSDVTVGMGYNTAPADPENPGVMTHNSVDNVAYSWCAATLALRPAVEAPGGEGGAVLALRTLSLMGVGT